MPELDRVAFLVETGRVEEIENEITSLLQQGVPIDVILRDGIMAGMQEVGRKFALQEYYLPEMLCAARAVKRVERTFRQQMAQSRQFPQKVLLGTVKNDLHDIGKNLVHIAIENVGFEVVDLGVDVSAEQFVQAAEADEAIRFVGISALLTTTMPDMCRTVDALKRCRAASRLTILVGGAPVTDHFAKEIGAIFTETAFDAAETIHTIAVEEMR